MVAHVVQAPLAEHDVEGRLPEGHVLRVGGHEPRAGHVLLADLEHLVADVEAHGTGALGLELGQEEARPAADVQHPRGGRRRVADHLRVPLLLEPSAEREGVAVGVPRRESPVELDLCGGVGAGDVVGGHGRGRRRRSLPRACGRGPVVRSEAPDLPPAGPGPRATTPAVRAFLRRAVPGRDQRPLEATGITAGGPTAPPGSPREAPRASHPAAAAPRRRSREDALAPGALHLDVEEPAQGRALRTPRLEENTARSREPEVRSPRPAHDEPGALGRQRGRIEGPLRQRRAEPILLAEEPARAEQAGPGDSGVMPRVTMTWFTSSVAPSSPSMRAMDVPAHRWRPSGFWRSHHPSSTGKDWATLPMGQ